MSLSCAAAEDLTAIRLGWQCPEDLLFRIPTYAIGRRIRRAASDAGVGDAYTGTPRGRGGWKTWWPTGWTLGRSWPRRGGGPWGAIL